MQIGPVIVVIVAIVSAGVMEGRTPQYGRFPKFHRVFLGRDPGTLKSDIVSNIYTQLYLSDLRLSN